MYITKQAEQEIYLIAQASNDGAPPSFRQAVNATVPGTGGVL